MNAHGPIEIPVDVPGRPYAVWVGAGILERAAEFIRMPERAEVGAVLADAAVADALYDRATAGLEATCLRTERIVIDAGEEAKTMARAEAILRQLAALGAHRSDLLVALGGGSVGDLAGFVAAVYHRGMPFVQMPTTLLAQVDAAIGGKTGVNLPEGKNLVGAFHQPRAVVADVTTLATLPAPEFASGMAEVVKHGLIADPEILEIVTTERAALAEREATALVRLVARAVTVKARVVAEDETEQAARAHLNYGHTLGHALEALGGYARWRHGEAVALGMMFVAHLAAELGYADRVREHAAALDAAGLPVRGADQPIEAVLAAMGRDKKYRGGIRFVVLEDLGKPRLVRDVPEDAIRRAYAAVQA